MGDPSPPCEALSLLSRAFRRRSTGTLWLGSGVDAVQVVVRKGEVVAVRPGPDTGVPKHPIPEPDGSVRLQLQRVLTQVGLGVSGLRRSPAVSARDLRERLLEHLAREGEARLEEADTVLNDRDRSVGPTEPLLLEALGRLPKDAVTRGLLGGLDRSLVLPPDRRGGPEPHGDRGLRRVPRRRDRARHATSSLGCLSTTPRAKGPWPGCS